MNCISKSVLCWNYVSVEIHVNVFVIYADNGVMGNCGSQRFKEEPTHTPPKSQQHIAQNCASNKLTG